MITIINNWLSTQQAHRFRFKVFCNGLGYKTSPHQRAAGMEYDLLDGSGQSTAIGYVGTWQLTGHIRVLTAGDYPLPFQYHYRPPLGQSYAEWSRMASPLNARAAAAQLLSGAAIVSQELGVEHCYGVMEDSLARRVQRASGVALEVYSGWFDHYGACRVYGQQTDMLVEGFRQHSPEAFDVARQVIDAAKLETAAA